MGEFLMATMMELTDDERDLILERRAEVEHENATLRFQKEVFDLAYKYYAHLEEEGECSSFSGFISFFNPPHDDLNRVKYEAVVLILETVSSLQIPKAKTPN
jgi:hypothetical protein